MEFQHTLEFAKTADNNDKLKYFRDEFHIPQHNCKPTIYFTGNSLGLQPKKTKEIIFQELDDWAKYGVEGHFMANRPWVSYHELFPALLSPIIGGHPSEIVAMNQLTSNLHFLFVSFYRPTKSRYKIIMEGKAFPSDQYAVESQVKFHGFLPDDAIIEVFPREGETCLRTEDITDAIEKNKDSIALVFFSGVNYYTGQVFDIKSITQKAKEINAICGFDLAHAAGNVELNLHDWGVDFATWCSYKYLNSGPGGVSGVFIHEKHSKEFSLPRFTGWWGHDKNTRFKMDKTFVPMEGAEGWQLSNAPVLSMAAHYASLKVFEASGFENLLHKSKLLTDYLVFLLQDLHQQGTITIITPFNTPERGCQISMLIKNNGKQVYDGLMKEGVIVDWREPDVIRLAPVPLYNSFEDVYNFITILRGLLKYKVL
jgi:kynureninase